MNSRFVTVSLVLNVALLGLVGWMFLNLKDERLASNLPEPEQVFVTNTVKQITVRKVAPSNFWAALAATQKPNWSLLESTNYVNYIENLRSIGCPDETIRDIIIADIAKTYGKKRASVRAQAPPQPYWMTDDAWKKTAEGAALHQQLHALDDEERVLVKELLGVDLHVELAKFGQDSETQDTQYNFLPEEKRPKVMEIEQQIEQLSQAILQNTKGVILPEDRERIRKLKKQKEEELAKVLTPEELENYLLRNSSTASGLRAQMAGFEVSEEEFRKMFRVQKTYEDQFGDAFNVADPSQIEIQERAREEAQQALNAELKRELGEKRFVEYQRSRDADYVTLAAMAERFGGSPDMAAKVYDMRQEAELQKRALENNPNLTAEQREAGLAALAKETQRQMAQTLGGNNSQLWKAYQQTGAQQWLENLNISEVPVTVEPEPVDTTPVMPNFPPFPPFPPMPVTPAK